MSSQKIYNRRNDKHHHHLHYLQMNNLNKVMEQLLPTSKSYEVEMDEMVVMESLDLVDSKAGMARWDYRGRKVTWENRDLLDQGLEESLISGGVELPAQTQQELNLSILDELLDLTMAKKEELVITCVYLSSLST